MIASQLMLITIVISWLYAQYREQQQQLSVSLKQALKDAEEAYTDSLLHGIMADLPPNTIRFTPDSMHGTHQRVSSHQNVSMIIATDKKDSLKINEIKRKITRRSGDDSMHIEITDNGNRRTTTIRPNGNPTVQQAIQPALEFILKKLVIKDGDIARELNFGIDSAIIRQLFAKQLALRHQHFTVVWDSAKAYHAQHNNKPILLQSSLFATGYYVAVDKYDAYIIRKLVPEIIFTVFLLGLTAAAFLFTYHTLRQQIRLSTMKDEFIGNMSHELKTPISTVKVALEAINGFNPISDNQTTRDYLRMATLETERLELLVNRVLNTSLLESGKIALHKEPHDIAALVNTTLQAMQVRFKQSNAQVRLHVNNTDTTTDVDILHLQGVLINLLDNSLKYNAEIPVIDITVAHDGARLTLSVTDNGPGIPTEYTDRVFDKFFRVPTGDRHNVKGYGLGLSYVKQITEQHGGNITVKNNEKGCTFTITLPKA